jgi:hypothetical protein
MKKKILFAILVNLAGYSLIMWLNQNILLRMLCALIATNGSYAVGMWVQGSMTKNKFNEIFKLVRGMTNDQVNEELKRIEKNQL